VPGDRGPSKRKSRPERERIEYAPDALGWLREQLEPVPQQLPPDPQPPNPPGPTAPNPPRQAMAQLDPPPPEPTRAGPPAPQPTPAAPPPAAAGPPPPPPPAPAAEAPAPAAKAPPAEAPAPAAKAPPAGAPAPSPAARAPRTSKASAAQAGPGKGHDLSSDQLLARLPGGPTLGWQAVVYQVSGGRVRPAPGPAERARQQLAARIGAPVAGCQRIAVVALKGGVGKTTTTACLGAIFAEHRGDRVVAVDANPDPGTLGYRIRRDTTRTAKDLLDNVDKLERYADVRAYASQTDLRLEVIASEADPGRDEAFGEADYRELAAVLERFYSLVLTDCGPGLLHSAMRAILPAADQLLVVATPTLDGARSASLTLDWLDKHGYGRLASSSVVVINAVRERGPVDVDKLDEHFARRCRAVVRIPFDRHLETGAEIVLDELSPATHRAYVQLAAAVADGFRPPSPNGGPD
jgi:MinD-like ATPase involved in chromosome partitioning or flagellar assembly